MIFTSFIMSLTSKKEGEEMSEKERKEIKAMVQTAKYLADHDPQGLMLAKATMDILKARSVLENATQEQAQKEAS